MKIRNLLLTFVLLAVANVLMANDSNPDFFRSIGKIYVVVAVVVATFIGIVFFLMYIDRKIRKIEKEISSHQ